MNRICIPEGEIIKLNNAAGLRCYEIVGVIGRGAHCIAYEAHSIDSVSRRVRIKECYPANSNIDRNGLEVIWKDEQQKKMHFDMFKNAFEKQVLIQNDVNFGNSFTHVVDDICEANGTLYTVVDIDNGVTFMEDTAENLVDILETVTALAKVIKLYHKQGYLHLDIKPENFLVLPETRDLIKLLDADTIVKKEDLLLGDYSVIPYSFGWAAPEQIQGKLRKVSEKTDIFAIGAILFEKITGECPDNDDIGVYADYEIPEYVIKNYDSRIETALKRIFRKTITASTNRRFDSIDELIGSLDDAVRICSNDKYILPKEAVSDIFFVGRKSEMADIHEKLSGGVKAIFLHGFGGIGKTELAKKYVQEYKEEYDVTRFDRYSDEKGLKQYIEYISIKGYDDFDSDFEKKYKEIEKLCSERTLFVVDNFDVDDDEMLDRLLSLNAKFIFTTRNDHSEMCSDDIVQVELETMDIEDLMPLFIHEYGRNLSDSEDEYVRKIIRRFDNYTMMVPLIAKQLKVSECSFEDFWSKIEEEGLAFFGEDTESVKHRKDGIITQASLLGHMNHLFKLSDLDEAYKCVLANVKDLDDHRGLTKSVYREYTQTSNLTMLNALLDRGWIEKEYVYDYSSETDVMYLRLHPVISELVDEALAKPEYHQAVISFVSKKLQELNENPEDEEILENIGDVLTAYASVVEIDDHSKEKFQELHKFICYQYGKGNLDVDSILFSSNDFRVHASDSYFLDSIFEMVKTNHEAAENTISNTFARLKDMYVEKAVRLYTYYFEGVGTTAYKYVYLLIMISLLKTASEMLEKKDESSDESDVAEESISKEELIEPHQKLLNALMNYMQISPIEENKWVINERGYEGIKFDITDSHIATAEMYLRVAELVYREYEYYFELDVDKASELFLQYRNLIMVIEYYQGNMFLPSSFNPEPIGVYLDRWISIGSRSIEFDDGGKMEYEDEEVMSLTYCTDKAAWRKEIGKSVKRLMETSSFDYDEYKLILDSEFLSKQPASVRAAMVKGNIAMLVSNDSRISEEQKREILIDVPCAQMKKIMSMSRRYKSTKSFATRYSKIFDIYMSCLEFYLEEMSNEAGITLSSRRADYFLVLLKLYSFKKVKNEVVVDVVLKDIAISNIEKTAYLLKLISGVYGMGLHKRSKELQIELLKLWDNRDLVNTKDCTIWIDFIMTMKENAKRLKDNDALVDIDKEISKLSIEDMVEYVSNNNGFTEYREPLIKNVYWSMLLYACDVLDGSEGYYDLLNSERFEEICELANKLSSIIQDEELGQFRMKQYFENLLNSIEGSLNYTHRPNRRMVAYFMHVYQNQARYDVKGEYIGGKYIYLAELALGKDNAKYVFDSVDGDKECTSEEYVSLKAYLS